jgi:exodeoxyribonuclease VII large subunit
MRGGRHSRMELTSHSAEFDLGPEGGTRAESVTEFTRRIKVLLESGLRPGWVRGEVTNLRVQASGHIYFALKDAGAQIRGVMFRGDATKQTVKLREGSQVVAWGEVSVYEARGEYQLIVRAVLEDGVGRLQREFEALKARLAAEGLFARERKRALPSLPRTIGFVTSPTGAAVQDFLRILIRRGWRGRVVVLPAKVQGEAAAEECAAMIRWANGQGLAQELSFDLLVVGRGGGSLEDLWAFNEEVLVRAVAESRVPVLSAVGHEIDFTLCDFAADVRAETPSAAAELVSSGFVAEGERLERIAERLGGAVAVELATINRRLERADERLRLLSPAAQVERGCLRVDDLRNRLAAALAQGGQERRHLLAVLAGRLAAVGPSSRVEREAQRLRWFWKRLQAASPTSVLKRGFAIVRDEAGRPLTELGQLQPSAQVEIELGGARRWAQVK